MSTVLFSAKKEVPKMKRALGTHILLEFWGCDPFVLTNSTRIKEALDTAARASNAKVVTDFYHQFHPYGVSGIIIIEESHFSIHTWPEHGYAAIDLLGGSWKTTLTVSGTRNALRKVYVTCVG
ncbi:adenosylmethionine decarboxylase [candidate division bacterium WOR-3 4484_18]|uniref:Adenosylmethionine decarboxylase n=1 Tax=candidate division WOR-3 bacterium 4484_18 TaxID=2020626 RepID=A0A257LUK4_UNCW3|nr:MAG: adenosylmethionine decarboxylase [candidate division bacterium WOR-3 4484_18]